MQDYMSQYPQPELNERIARCAGRIPKSMSGILSPKKFEEIIHRVVEDSPNYSQTGYAAFGLNANVNMVIYEIEKYIKANVDYLLDKYSDNADKVQYMQTLVIG